MHLHAHTQMVDRAVCPVQERCGGCPLMQHALDAQRKIKLARVRGAFAAMGVPAPEPEWTAGPDRAYRNRLRLRIDAGQLVFFNPDKSVDCAVLEPNLRQTIDELRAVVAEEPEQWREFAWLEARGKDSDGVASVCLAPHESLGAEGALPSHLEAARRTLQQRLSARTLVGVHGQAQPPLQRYCIEGVDIHVALGAFLQVNHQVNAQLVRHVLGCATMSRATEFLDLYAGCGNFALPLAARGLSGTAVEVSAPSIASLRAGVAAAQTGRLRVIRADVAAALPELASTPSGFVIADPPRAGLGGAAGLLRQVCTHTLLLVSCNPKSLARDIAQLAPDFDFAELRGFDMFPHTDHIELVAQLTRKH